MPGPFQSNQERLVGEALAANTADSNVLRGMTRRPLFMPRWGWRQDAITVEEVLGLGRVPGAVPLQMQRTYFSGTAADINAGARNVGGSVGV